MSRVCRHKSHFASNWKGSKHPGGSLELLQTRQPERDFRLQSPFTGREHLARPLKVIGKGIAPHVPALPAPLKYLHELEAGTKV